VKYRIALVAALCCFPVFAQAQEDVPPPGSEGTLPADAEPQAVPAATPAPDAAAEPDAEVAAPRPARKGFLGGAAFGLGSVKLGCSNGQGCGHYAGIGFSLDAGYAFAPRWAIVGEMWFTGGISNADSNVAGQLLTFSANARFWVLERFWVQGGLAATSFDLLRQSGGNVASGGGGGLVLGAGAELWRAQNGHLVIDLRAKVGLLSVSDMQLGDNPGKKIDTRQTTAMVTISWY